MVSLEFKMGRERRAGEQEPERRRSDFSNAGRAALLMLPALSSCAAFAPKQSNPLARRAGIHELAETLYPKPVDRNYYEVQAAAVSEKPQDRIGIVFKAREEKTDFFSGVWVNGHIQNRFYQFGLFNVSDKVVPGAPKNKDSFVIGYEKWYKNYTVFPFNGILSQVGFIPTRIRQGDTVRLELSVGNGEVRMEMRDMTTGEHKEYELKEGGSSFSPGVNKYGNFTGVMHESASFKRDIKTDFSLRYRIVGATGGFSQLSDEIGILVDKMSIVGGNPVFKVQRIATDVTASVRDGILGLERQELSPK